MRFIVVDTADARGSVALFEGAQFQGVEEHSTEEDYSSWLLPAVKRVLLRFAVSLAELDSYAVCAGPGSFTGLRVGLTTVKAWAEIYGKPIVALSRLEALTLSGRTAQDRLMPDYGSAATYRFTATYFDARREQVFAALYRQSGGAFKAVEEESVTGLPNFLAWVRTEAKDEPVRWITPDVDLLTLQPDWASMAKKGHMLQFVPPPFAIGLGRLAYRKFLQGQRTDAISFDANYVRRSDAELFWKENKPTIKS